MINYKDIDNPIIFKLPYLIDYQDQKTVLDYAYSNSNSWSGQVQVWDNDTNNYDQTDYFGRVQITRLTELSIKKLSNTFGYNSNWLNWAGRLHPDLEWEWIDTPITPILKSLVDKIKHLYIKFNRVLILVQKEGSEIPLHTDKAVRNVYETENFIPGPAKNLNFNDNDIHWHYNKFLTLKFPLTMIPNNNGKPKIKIKDNEYFYDVKNNLFAINEVNILHGADAVNHKRGVIFLDGILNYDALKKESWLDVSLKENK